MPSCHPNDPSSRRSPRATCPPPWPKDVFGRDAIIEIVHAGLECGIIADKVPGLEAVSFGPLIKGAHTPEEWADVKSTAEIWKLLAALLKEV